MIEKIIIQNHKYTFFKNAEETIKNDLIAELESIERKLSLNSELFLILRNLIDSIVFLYKDENSTAFIEAKIFNISLGKFKIVEAVEIPLGAQVVLSFPQSEKTTQILHEISLQIFQSIIDDLFTLLNLMKSNP